MSDPTPTPEERAQFEAFILARWGEAPHIRADLADYSSGHYSSGTLDFGLAAFMAGRASLATPAPGPLDALREMADQGHVMVSAWVVQDEVCSYRVTARGRDSWRKSADAKTLEGAILAADAEDWAAPPAIKEEASHE